MAAIRKPRTEEQKAARRLREGSAIRPRCFVSCTKPHLTGDALIAHIKAFDKARNLRSGNMYSIGGKEVRV